LSKYLGCEMKIFNIEEIKDIEHKYEGSTFVEKTLGIKGVCEPVVELAGGKLEVHKIKLQGMTLAIGKEV
ncbi:MAG: cobalamin biosynthesis protein, partial [Peptostreptococcaceae bacterium]